MKPEIVFLQNRMIVGVYYKGSNDYSKLHETWQELEQRLDEIEHKAPGGQFFGISEPLRDEEDLVQYLAGVEVERIDKVPEGMQAWFLKHEKYVFATHRGMAADVARTYDMLYRETIPGLGLQASDDYDFEVYTKDFREGNSDKLYVFVPVEDPKPVGDADQYSGIRKMLFPEGLFKEDTQE